MGDAVPMQLRVRFTDDNMAELDKRGVGVYHLYKFFELVLNEAMVRQDLLRTHDVRQTFSIIVPQSGWHAETQK